MEFPCASRDGGVVSVLRDGRVEAMVTDGDICMATLMEGKPPWALAG